MTDKFAKMRAGNSDFDTRAAAAQSKPQGDDASAMPGITNYPVARRHDINHMVAAEMVILDAMRSVENMGPDRLLTKAMVRLTDAKNFVGDYVDSVYAAGGESLKLELDPTRPQTNDDIPVRLTGGEYGDPQRAHSLPHRDHRQPGDFPKVTEADMLARIVSKDFHRLGDDTVTVCNLKLDNGYSVRGESACVDPRNYNKDIGENFAYADAFRKLWPLFGFLLAEKMYEDRKPVGSLTWSGSTAVPAAPINEWDEGSFGWAIRSMRNGNRVAREGWNGKGMWITYSPGVESMSADKFFSLNNAAFAGEQGGHADVLPCITMKTADGKILMGWLASQSDMLASDWGIV